VHTLDGEKLHELVREFERGLPLHQPLSKDQVAPLAERVGLPLSQVYTKVRSRRYTTSKYITQWCKNNPLPTQEPSENDVAYLIARTGYSQKQVLDLISQYRLKSQLKEERERRIGEFLKDRPYPSQEEYVQLGAAIGYSVQKLKDACKYIRPVVNPSLRKPRLSDLKRIVTHPR
jgi:hypothetical protein